MPSLQLDSSGTEQNGLVDVEKTKAKDCLAFSQRRVEFHLARKGLSASSSTCNFSLVTLNPCSSSLSTRPLLPSSSDKRNPYDFFDSALDTELSFRIPSLRIGAGLENLGNTCFLNSVIQCLTYTEPLVAYMQSGKHHYSCHITGFCALCAIHKHVSRALQSTGRILAPKDLVSNLRCISRSFRNARQEDAHEYMIHLLESMHKCSLPSGVLPESPGAYEKSLVYKIFGGRLRSQVKCLQCSYCSNTFDLFLDLSLEIVKADSLFKAFTHFTAAEQLDGGERQYKCERCMQKVKAFKQLTIYKAPYVLGIHLKRFCSYLAEKKIDKKVHFGTTLNLKPFVSGAYDGDMMYKLYGVLVHAGWSTHSGHYYCFVRTSSGLWYSLDDRRVVQVSERTVLEQKAYMLFYVRDRKNFTPKEVRDDVKENLMTTMRNASNSCSIPGVKVFQNGCVDKHSTKTISPGFVVKDSESSTASEVLVQQNISQSAIQPSIDSGICKEGVLDRTMDIHSVGNKLKRKLPCSKGSIPTKSPRFTLRRQSMKMILKSRIVGTHLSTKMLYEASLSLRKRRKCRRAKQSKKSVLQHLLTKDLVSVDFGPSTSGSDSCWGEGAKDSDEKCSMSYDSNSSVVNPVAELEDKITCRKTLLVTGKLPQKSASCSLEANLIGVGDSSYPKQLNSQLQNGVNVAGSRGQEDIAVGRWEGIVPHEISESNGRNSFSIGYVLDDWDEEYDRGKRKKVRVLRNGFDGLNPFQETAVKKAS